MQIRIKYVLHVFHKMNEYTEQFINYDQRKIWKYRIKSFLNSNQV